MGNDADREKHEVLKIEEFETQKAIDTTALISDLSHQLEEARAEIETLRGANREWHLQVVRLEGARNALRELLTDVLQQRP